VQPTHTSSIPESRHLEYLRKYEDAKSHIATLTDGAEKLAVADDMHRMRAEYFQEACNLSHNHGNSMKRVPHMYNLQAVVNMSDGTRVQFRTSPVDTISNFGDEERESELYDAPIPVPVDETQRQEWLIEDEIWGINVRICIGQLISLYQCGVSKFGYGGGSFCWKK